jgi:hypothetical protein
MRTLQNARNDTQESGDWLSTKLQQRTTADQLDPKTQHVMHRCCKLVLVWGLSAHMELNYWRL